MDPAALALVIVTIVIASIYNFVNGMNDCANSIATTVSTRVLSPRVAVLLAGVLNIAGAFISTEVAKTIGKNIIDPDVLARAQGGQMLGIVIILAGVLGAAIWGAICTYKGIPISLTHSLVGGLIGAALVGFGTGCLKSVGIYLILAAMIISPIAGFIGAYFMMIIIYRLSFRMHPRIANFVYGKLQILSAAWMAFSHGFNDTQNAMGVIAASLLYAGFYNEFTVPVWVILLSAVVMGAGTYIGGWRVIKTMGMGICDLKPIHGFTAETSAGTVIAGCSWFGAPISTSHVISTAIMGVGATKKLSAVRWGIVGNILLTWLLTMPGAAIIGACAFWFLDLFF
jgi:PiT family inorganic phosphate transporter